MKKISELKKEAWKWFSRYVRVKDAINGYVVCVTSGKKIKWKESQAGHFIHASKGSPVTYDERNVHPQSRFDNYCNDERVRDKYLLFGDGGSSDGGGISGHTVGSDECRDRRECGFCQGCEILRGGIEEADTT